MDNELLLIDRLGVIRDTINSYGEDNFYISFSGGKDSVVVSRLVDMALPNNRIPRVFINTGIEYNDIVAYVKERAETDDRITIIKPSKPIKETLETHGYPFKSKEHAKKVDQWQRHHKMTKYLMAYLQDNKGKYTCPNILRYQFTDDLRFPISGQCCSKLKKEPFSKYEKACGKTISITGLKREEGGTRENIKGCAVYVKNKLKHFHPLLPVTEEFEDWLIERERETVQTVLRALQLQADRVQGMPICPYPARAVRNYGEVYACRA